MQRVSFLTLGCKVNQAETLKIKRQFLAKGLCEVPFSSPAEIIVINTCSVTHVAERKSRNLIRRALKLNPSAKLVVCGCYANLQALKLKDILPQIYRVILAEDKLDIERWGLYLPDTVVNYTEKITKIREFLKVQDGCDQFCSYCIIPYARNNLYSIPPDQLLQEAKLIAGKGCTELVLTGINIGKYNYNGFQVADLLLFLANNLPQIKRFRISSIEPNLITTKLLEVIASDERFAKHLHIPLQSGSNTILKLMERRYLAEEYQSVIAATRQAIPNVAITTDLIIGFPGETESTFAETVLVLKNIGFSNVHLFRYSPRAGTKSYGLKQLIDEDAISHMIDEATMVVDVLGDNYRNSLVGKEVAVMVENIKGGFAQGLTAEYVRAKIKLTDNLAVAQVYHGVVLKNQDGLLLL